ncbi:MAG: zf-HC2 domain-containing protein [Acidobacteriota bacterium]|nr:zf-HC2 domain-containing protein [Acidobacteriota bacterium]
MTHAKLKEALAEAGRAAEAELTEHPDDAVLEDYLDELLEEDVMEAVREHLTWCRRCSGVLKEMDVPPGFEVDPDLKDLPEMESSAGAEVVRHPSAWVRYTVPGFLLGAAAMFLVMLALAPPALEGGALVQALQPGTRGSGPVVRPGATHVVLTLRFRVQEEGAYDVSGSGPDGFAWGVSAQQSDGLGYLNISMAMPPPGDYRFVVSGPGGEMTYHFKIEP